METTQSFRPKINEHKSNIKVAEKRIKPDSEIIDDDYLL